MHADADFPQGGTLCAWPLSPAHLEIWQHKRKSPHTPTAMHSTPEKDCCPPGISQSVHRKTSLRWNKCTLSSKSLLFHKGLGQIELYKKRTMLLSPPVVLDETLDVCWKPRQALKLIWSVKCAFDGFPEKQCTARRAGVYFLRSVLPCLTWSYFEWSAVVIRSFVLCKGQRIYSCHTLSWR